MPGGIARSILLAVSICALWGQSFEAASVKRNTSGRNAGSIGRSGGQLAIENTSLRECIATAYGISADREDLLAGPAWIGSERYDIVAKVPAEIPKAQVLRMLQALLAERFHLQLHRENRDLRVYLLTLARSGAKLKSVPESEDSFTWGAGHISCKATSMAQFADKLSRPMFGLGAPVIDSTGLAGAFDFTLDWTPDNPSPEAAAGPSLFSALQEQLGLKLAPSKSQVEVLVIDRAGRIPAEN